VAAFELDWQSPSLNTYLRTHWAKRVKAHRDLSLKLATALGRGPFPAWRPGMTIHLYSFRKRRLDHDNLVGGMKPLRDSIARMIGVDDADSNFSWRYTQVIEAVDPRTLVVIR
jgi:hypothetical protein